MTPEKPITIPNTKNDIRTLPTTTGIYQYLDAQGTILYIGKSVNLKARILSHAENAKTDPKEAGFVDTATHISYFITDSEFKALLLESQLIGKWKPKYNVRWRDDKSFLYIKLNMKDRYPKVALTRREHQKNAEYFGPFPSVRAAEQIIREIRRVIPFCMQKRIYTRACFYSKIGLCDPCPSAIERLDSEDEKTISRQRYKRHIQLVRKVLNGRTDIVLKRLYQELKDRTNKQEYEEAIHIRDRIIHLEGLLTRKRLEPDTLSDYNQSKKSIDMLKKLLQKYVSTESLQRIECYDMSVQGADHATASMVVFTEGLIDKKEYRKFKIKNQSLRSDFERLEEILSRRFKQSWTRPDLIVIDGGKPQVRVALRVCAERDISTPVIGIAKHPDRLIIGTEGTPIVRPPRTHLGFNLIRAIRDESHRFANKYSSFLKSKQLFSR
jgi:excinuclease ABC subunit C